MKERWAGLILIALTVVFLLSLAQLGLLAQTGGGVHSFGYNADGRLGLGDTVQCDTPTKIMTLSGVQAISADGRHSLVLLKNGDIYAFGVNDNGQLGLGNTINRSTPTKIPILFDVKAISGDSSHSLVLLKNGNMYSFGANDNGQLGLGDTVNRSTPTKISILSGVKAISAGGFHSLVLLKNGDVYSFGANDNGQLGLGDTVNRSTPTKIPTLSGVKAISTGWHHSLVLLKNGDVYSFGRNWDGQLGLDSYILYFATPTKIPTLSEVKAISAGGRHSLVLLENGDVYSFGRNRFGQLGLGYTSTRATSTKIPTLSEVKAISAGGSHSLVLLENGEVYSFGLNWYGQLGIGYIPDLATPTKIPTLFGVRDIAAGGSHSLVLVGEPAAPLAIEHLLVPLHSTVALSLEIPDEGELGLLVSWTIESHPEWSYDYNGVCAPGYQDDDATLSASPIDPTRAFFKADVQGTYEVQASYVLDGIPTTKEFHIGSVVSHMIPGFGDSSRDYGFVISFWLDQDWWEDEFFVQPVVEIEGVGEPIVANFVGSGDPESGPGMHEVFCVVDESWNGEEIEFSISAQNLSDVELERFGPFSKTCGAPLWGCVVDIEGLDFTNHPDDIVNDNLDPRTVARLLVNLGVEAAKFWMTWSLIESDIVPDDPGGSSTENWSLYDSIIETFNRYGIMPVPLISDGSDTPTFRDEPDVHIAPFDETVETITLGEGDESVKFKGIGKLITLRVLRLTQRLRRVGIQADFLVLCSGIQKMS